MTTRAVVLADTHMPRRARVLPRPVLTALAQADLVIHLGDFTETELASALASLAPLYAVHGNNDSAELRAQLPATLTIVVEGHSLVLIHGHLGGRTALAAARNQTADVILFGHSHRAWCSREGNRLLFNPGSPTDRRWAPQRTFGVLDLWEGNVDASIIPVP